MSADTCIIYFGVRYDVTPDEFELIESKRDARQIAARRVGLKSYWGIFLGHDRKIKRLLFVGKEVAIFGPENLLSTKITPEHLSVIITETCEQLRLADFVGEVALHCEWLADI
ncbi:hypothetical protein TPR58_04510 [Sphingomonas sp. HF-S3]|uniref:Uncharacterized protein n=1 Tax=Sphingomonas rustica TaxID=3103142 RepID=A0ABV0B4B3_9SPHN